MQDARPRGESTRAKPRGDPDAQRANGFRLERKLGLPCRDAIRDVGREQDELRERAVVPWAHPLARGFEEARWRCAVPRAGNRDIVLRYPTHERVPCAGDELHDRGECITVALPARSVGGLGELENEFRVIDDACGEKRVEWRRRLSRRRLTGRDHAARERSGEQREDDVVGVLLIVDERPDGGPRAAGRSTWTCL